MKICSRNQFGFVKMTEINIRWAFNCSKWNPTQDEMTRCTTFIQHEEKERLGRFVFKNDFKSSLVGRLLMRKFVAEVTNTPYNEVIFARNDKGKPILISPPFEKIQFNVSHQGDFVVLAGSNVSNYLGVDIMKMEYKEGKKLSEFFRIMNRQFSNFEWETIKCGTDCEQIKMFYRHWCLKESYVKALGVGITVNLQDISFKVLTKNLKSDEIVNDSKLYLNGLKQDWQFHEMLLNNDHCIAVAMKGFNNKEVKFRELCIEELLENGAPILQDDSEYCNNYFKKLDKS